MVLESTLPSSQHAAWPESSNKYISLSVILFLLCPRKENLFTVSLGLCLVVVTTHGLSLSVMTGGFSLVGVHGLLIAVASLLLGHGSRVSSRQ